MSDVLHKATQKPGRSLVLTYHFMNQTGFCFIIKQFFQPSKNFNPDKVWKKEFFYLSNGSPIDVTIELKIGLLVLKTIVLQSEILPF